MHLSFSKALENLVVKSTLIRVHFKETSAEDFMKSIFNDAFAILCSDFLFKSICCGYSFELPQLVEAVQMSTTTYVFI